MDGIDKIGSKTISFKMNADKLQFYTANRKLEVELSHFEVFVRTNASTKLKKSFKYE